ncbi:putative reverse transcriptase domain-containing protein, partial [Tanacetum coccineum]
IKGNGKTTKETPTTITPTTTTTTATETTTITNNKIGDRKLPGPMLQPQLRVGVMLGIYQGETVATLTTMDNALQSVRSAKELVIKRRTAELGFQNEGSHGRAYVVVENPQQNPNVVTGTFLLNDHYACILFDSGAEKSFVSFEFTLFINIALVTLNTSYEVELVTNRLSSFDVIIGMDWLAYHRALIDCYEKIIIIPISNGKILEVQGEKPEKDLRSLACIKADKKKLDDIRVVRDFSEVFLSDLLGLPLVREIEFRIDLIPGVSPVVRSPYRLKLCNAHVLALPDGPNDFVVYCDASKQGFGVSTLTNKSLSTIFDQKDLNIRDFEYEIKYHRAANVVADGLETKILEAHSEASEDLKAPTEWLRGLERHFEQRDDGEIYFFDCICRKRLRLKPNIRNPQGFLQQPEIPEWKMEKITYRLCTQKLPKSSSEARYDLGLWWID